MGCGARGIRISAATASIVSESTENAALNFISPDLLAALNCLTQGGAPFFDCLNKSTEGFANTIPPAFQVRFSTRLLRSVNDHAPFTTFSIDPPEPFPTRNSPHPTRFVPSSTCILSFTTWSNPRTRLLQAHFRTDHQLSTRPSVIDPIAQPPASVSQAHPSVPQAHLSVPPAHPSVPLSTPTRSA